MKNIYSKLFLVTAIYFIAVSKLPLLADALDDAYANQLAGKYDKDNAAFLKKVAQEKADRDRQNIFSKLGI